MSTSETSKPINEICPTSGKPVNPDALSTFEGAVIGFCCKEHRDQFESTHSNIVKAVAKKQVKAQ